MAKQPKRDADWTEATDVHIATLAAFNGSLVEAMSEAVGQYVEGVATLNREMTSFVSDRLRKNAEFGHSVAACRTFTEVTDMQQEWASRAAQDYMTEAQKLTEIGQTVMANGARWANE